MQKKFNILLTASSRRVAMVRGFRTALENLGIEGKVIATDTDPLSSSLRFCHKYHKVPLSSSKNYIPEILRICELEKIDMLVPTIDEELEVFGRNKKRFKDIGVIPVVSDEKVGKICRDKYKTAKFFSDNGFPFAETYLPNDMDFNSANYPLFIKPRMGRGSVGAFAIDNEKELRFFSDYVKKPVIQRYLKGVEMTIDVLAGLDGRILSIVPRERMVIRSGVCDRGITRKLPDLIDLTHKICEKLKIIGPVNLQCKIDGGVPTFFEINPRFSGAIQLSVASGPDFFTMLVKEGLGIQQEPTIGDFKDGVIMLSYEESIFENGASGKIK